jgi:hypothetical protein
MALAQFFYTERGAPLIHSNKLLLLRRRHFGMPLCLLRRNVAKVSYSKTFKKEAEMLKIEPFNITKSPNRWRYSRYEEA